jgi:hypothetical protein
MWRAIGSVIRSRIWLRAPTLHREAAEERLAENLS